MSTQQNSDLHSYPKDFSIKVVGNATEQFQHATLSIMRSHFPDLCESTIQSRASRENTFLSLTVTILAQSRKQLDAVYRELSQEPNVLFAL